MFAEDGEGWLSPRGKRKRKRVVMRSLDLVTLNHAHHALGEAVVAFGVVVLVEVQTKDEGNAGVDVGAKCPDEGFGNLVARLVALAVDEFDEQASLRACETLDDGFIFFLQIGFYAVDVGLSLLFGECLDEVVGFDDGDFHHFRVGEEHLDVVDQTIVPLAFFFVLEGDGRIFVDVGHDDVGDAVAFVESLAHFHVEWGGSVEFAGVFGHLRHVVGDDLGVRDDGKEETTAEKRIAQEFVHNTNVLFWSKSTHFKENKQNEEI